jgi:ABC-2 type transport system permease protein
MKTIIHIAKNELRNLFYSPVAWFLAIVLLILCGNIYMSILQPAAQLAEATLESSPGIVNVLTESVTAIVYQAYFSHILPQLYLFVPLLTMGIISREFTSGTHKLLYSSPVTTRQMVLGKYLALMIYNLILLLIAGIFIVSGSFDIKDMDLPQTLSASLGMYLFLCALTAIGLFTSSLSTYPIVAAIASFTILFLLMSIGELWQQYDLVRDITWFLSVRDRTEKMVRGLIRSKDLIYYLVIIYMFVGFTITKLRSGRESRPWYIKTGRYIVIVVSGLLVGYIGSRPRFAGQWDTTAIKTNTLQYRTREVLNELRDGVLEVTLYTNLLSKDAAVGLPKARNAWLDLWEPYIQIKQDIEFRYEYFYAITPGDSSYYKKFPGKTIKQIAGLVAKGLQVDSSLFKSPEQISSLIDLNDPENYTLFAQLRYKGRSAIFRFLPSETGQDLNNGSTEPHIIAALHRLLGTSMPKIAFVSGDLERSIYKWGEREYYGHTMAKLMPQNVKRNALMYLGFDVDTLNLATQEISPDIAVLVLADPKRELGPVALSKLWRYIDEGRNLFILGEPGKQYVLNPVLQHIGVHLTDGQLVQPSDAEPPDKIIPYWTRPYIGLAEEPGFIFWRRWFRTNLKPDTLGGLLQGVTGISYSTDSGFVVKPLLLTLPDKTWLKMGKLVADSVPPVFSPEQGDLKMPSFPVALQLTRKKQNREQRIVVYGDADIASNLRLQTDLVRSVYSWLVYNQFPVYTRPLPAKDNIIILGPRRAAIQKIIYVWILPGVLLLIATMLLIRRKKQ